MKYFLLFVVALPVMAHAMTRDECIQKIKKDGILQRPIRWLPVTPNRMPFFQRIGLPENWQTDEGIFFTWYYDNVINSKGAHEVSKKT